MPDSQGENSMTCPKCKSESTLVINPRMVDETTVQGEAGCKKCNYKEIIEVTFYWDDTEE